MSPLCALPRVERGSFDLESKALNQSATGDVNSNPANVNHLLANWAKPKKKIIKSSLLMRADVKSTKAHRRLSEARNLRVPGFQIFASHSQLLS